MRPIALIVAALLCVVCSSANARPRHLSIGHLDRHIGDQTPSCDVMRPCYGNGRPLFDSFQPVHSVARHRTAKHRAERQGHRRVSEGVERVMAEGAGRVVNWAKPRAWCGWFMRREFGVANPAGNLARWWAGFGRPAHGPAVGAIVVWRHHVGKITGRTADGQWIVKSGNDGHSVRERPRSVAGAIAFRWPA